MADGDNNRVRQAWAVIADAVGHLNADDGWAMASHVALSGLMALFPFVIFVAALAGFVGEEPLASQVVRLVFESWPPEVAGPIAGQVQQVVAGAQVNLLTISAVVALFLASNGVEAARVALNRAYRVVDRRSFIKLRAQSFVFVLVGAVGSLILAFFAALVPSVLDRILADVPVLEPFGVAVDVARVIVPGVLIVAALAAAHLWLPAGRPHWRWLWPGVALTLVLWVVSAIVFAIYLQRFANLGATYGGLASVVSAMFFLYVLAASLIFGAEFNASLKRLRDQRIG